MNIPSTLLQEYRNALAAGAIIAPDTERSLYALHERALDDLEKLLLEAAPKIAILESILRGRQAFGRSFLSGPLGERVEHAFYVLASEIETLCA